MSTTPPAGLDWEDPTVYRWKIHTRIRDWWETLGYWLGGAVVYPMLTFGILWLLGMWVERVAYWIGIGVAVIFLLVLLQHFYLSIWGRDFERREARSIVYWTAIATLGVVLFVLTSPRSHLASGFSGGESASWWQWLLYLVDQIGAVVLFDIPESLLQLRLSPLQAEEFGARGVTLLIRTLILIGGIELLLEIIRSRFQEEPFYGSVKECYWHCSAIPDTDDMTVQREGSFEQMAAEEELPVASFLEGLKAEAKEEEGQADSST